MANNNVQTSCSLINNLLTTPPIGSSTSFSLAFADGDTASDTYVALTTSPSPLNVNILGDGFILVSNPATNTTLVALFCAAQAMGNLVPGASVLLPLSSGVVYNATSTPNQNVGVTVVECDPNT